MHILLSVIGGAFWVVPMLLVVAFLAFLFLAPLVAAANGVLRLYGVIPGQPGRISQAETQLATGVPMGRSMEVVDVFGTTRPARVEKPTTADREEGKVVVDRNR